MTNEWNYTCPYCGEPIPRNETHACGEPGEIYSGGTVYETTTLAINVADSFDAEDLSPLEWSGPTKH